MEAVTPDVREQLNVILDALRNDREKSWRMLPDGTYVREEGGEGTSSQEGLYRYFSNRKVSLIEETPAVPDVPEAPEAPDAPGGPEETASGESHSETEPAQAGSMRKWFRRMFG